jgi:hypothetical protein
MNVGAELRPVVGYQGRYSVAPDGRIWAHPNLSRRKGRWLKEARDRCGYSYVCLFNGARKNIKVHRIVAQAYLAASDKPHVNHLNGDKADNRVANLQWCTPSENKLHAWRTGLTAHTDTQKRAAGRHISSWNRAQRKLQGQEEQIAVGLRNAGLSQELTARFFGVSRSTVKRIERETRATGGAR